MKREVAGLALGAAAVALANAERRAWSRAVVKRAARALGAAGDPRVPTKLMLKRSAGVLDDADVPFFLSGGAACWAYGGPFPKDVDIVIAPGDVERATTALAAAGLRIVCRPERWLFQAYDHGLKVDVIYRPLGFAVDEALFRRSPRFEVDGVAMRVLCLEDVFVSRLLAVTVETLPRLARVLESARALREQVDWREVESRTAHSPFAKAFFTLVAELGVVDRSVLTLVRSA
jgi:hypothetical protein